MTRAIEESCETVCYKSEDLYCIIMKFGLVESREMMRLSAPTSLGQIPIKYKHSKSRIELFSPIEICLAFFWMQRDTFLYHFRVFFPLSLKNEYFTRTGFNLNDD